MRWNVSLTTPTVRDDTRTWADIEASVEVALLVIGVLRNPRLSRDEHGGMAIDGSLDAGDAAEAYQRATTVAALACRAAGLAVVAWSTVLVVSRPGVRPSG